MPATVAQTTKVAGSTTPLSTAAFASAPPSGDVVLTFVDSDTTMTSGPASATTRTSFVSNQGAYVYDKTAGASEPTTVTVTPNGGGNATTVASLDIAGTSGFDAVSTVSDVQSSSLTSATITSFTTAAGNGDLVIAAVLIHGWAGSAPASPVWNNGFTALLTAGPGTQFAATEAIIFMATKQVAAGTAIGTTTVTWTNAAHDYAAWHVGYKAATSPTSENMGAAATAWGGTTVTTSLTTPVSESTGAASLAWAGTTFKTVLGVSIAMGAAALALGSAAPTLDIITELDGGGPPALAWAATTAQTLIGVADTAKPAAISWAGTSVTLTGTSAVNENLGAAAMAWTAQPAKLVAGVAESTSPAAVGWSGVTITVQTGVVEHANSAAYAWAGTTVTTSATAPVTAHLGGAVIGWAGVTVTARVSSMVNAGASAVAWTGTIVTAVAGGTPHTPAAYAWAGTTARVSGSSSRDITVVTGPTATGWAPGPSAVAWASGPATT